MDGGWATPGGGWRRLNRGRESRLSAAVWLWQRKPTGPGAELQCSRVPIRVAFFRAVPGEALSVWSAGAREVARRAWPASALPHCRVTPGHPDPALQWPD